MQDQSAAAIRLGLELTRWIVSDLWIAASGIGGALSHLDIDNIATGQQLATSTQHDILATALNEQLADQGHNRPIRYWRDLPPDLP